MDTNKHTENRTLNTVINTNRKIVSLTDGCIIANCHKGYEGNGWDTDIKHTGRLLILANYSNHLVETANVSFSLQAGCCPRQHLNPR